MSVSTRCQEAAALSDTLTLSKVVCDMWNPITNPKGFVNLGTAENTLMQDILPRHIHENIQLPRSAFTYGDGTVGTKRLRQAIAQFLTKRLKPVKPLELRHISVTNGCNSAIEHLSWQRKATLGGLLMAVSISRLHKGGGKWKKILCLATAIQWLQVSMYMCPGLKNILPYTSKHSAISEEKITRHRRGGEERS